MQCRLLVRQASRGPFFMSHTVVNTLKTIRGSFQDIPHRRMTSETCSLFTQQTSCTSVSGQLPKPATCGSDPSSGSCSFPQAFFLSLTLYLAGFAPPSTLAHHVSLPFSLRHHLSVSAGDRRRLLCSLTVIIRSRSH